MASSGRNGRSPAAGFDEGYGFGGGVGWEGPETVDLMIRRWTYHGIITRNVQTSEDVMCWTILTAGGMIERWICETMLESALEPGLVN